MSGRIVRHVVVRGRVQGVGYRAFVEYEAQRRELDGWVRNRRDGSVEAVFAGPCAAVEAMIEARRRGPMSARIECARSTRRHGDRSRRSRGRRRVLGACRPFDPYVCPNSCANSRRKILSTLAIGAGMPRSARLVTP